MCKLLKCGSIYNKINRYLRKNGDKMRMRKKKNLDSRLENCKDITIELGEEKLNLPEIFGNDNPTYLEIGCGKGTFTREIALRNPNINFIAIEKVANVIVSAMEKAEKAELKNVRFMATDAENLTKIFGESEIAGLYLNFSCPYPKRRYLKHRLTHENFLNLYKIVLKSGARIYQKTDNRDFFEFSLKSFKDCGWKLENICYDLHHSKWNEENIVTEYEEKFSSQGLPIYRLEAVNEK